ncbi:MAG: hypothetical protein NVSMB30_18360 [Hymenobacter sp.]
MKRLFLFLLLSPLLLVTARAQAPVPEQPRALGTIFTGLPAAGEQGERPAAQGPGAEAPIKAVPQTERKNKPERVDDTQPATPPAEARSARPERSARSERSDRPERSARGTHGGMEGGREARGSRGLEHGARGARAVHGRGQ